MTDGPDEPQVEEHTEDEQALAPTLAKTEEIDLQWRVQRSYLDYAMSVIVGRALPDVRDGLKPVHRRVSTPCTTAATAPTAAGTSAPASSAR